jgi:hypothetical protein
MARKKAPPPPPTPEACQNVLAVMRSTSEPMAAKPFAKLLTGPHHIPESQLVPILEEFVSLGKLHAFPAKTAKGKPRYWDRDLFEFGRQTIRQTLEAKGPQTEAALRKALKGLDDAQCSRILKDAFAARELWRHPPVGKSKKELLGNRPPSPAAYLRDVGEQLTKTVRLLLSAHVSRDELRRTLVQLIESSGIPFAAPSAPEALRDSGSRTLPGGIDLVALMRRVDPGADRGALIGSRDLRRAAGIEKPQFDRAVLELARQGRVSLHRHDYPASLSDAERDELVSDGDGGYYVGLALRGAL